jgi:hypothetical protein
MVRSFFATANQRDVSSDMPMRPDGRLLVTRRAFSDYSLRGIGSTARANCLRTLYELVDALGEGGGLVFADEYGTWMIPVDEKQIIPAYLASLAATSTPEEYAAAALPLIRRDSVESFTNKTYAAAIRAADQAQRKHLKAEIARLRVRIRPDTRH